jgi:hypothetical protein
MSNITNSNNYIAVILFCRDTISAGTQFTMTLLVPEKCLLLTILLNTWQLSCQKHFLAMHRCFMAEVVNSSVKVNIDS